MKNTKKIAPDGGWGWMACFGVSLVNVSMDNFIFISFLNRKQETYVTSTVLSIFVSKRNSTRYIIMQQVENYWTSTA